MANGQQPDAAVTTDRVYAEVGENYRHFLGWRVRMIVGYFGALVALAVAFAWLQSAGHPMTGILIPIAGCVVTLVFWLFENRNRDIHRALLEAGQAIEQKMSSPKDGPYTRMATTREAFLSYSRTLDVLFFLVTLTLALAAEWLVFHDGILP